MCSRSVSTGCVAWVMSYALSVMVGRLWTKPALFLSCSGSDGSGLGGGAFHSPSPVRCHPPCQLSPDDVMSSTYLLPPVTGSAGSGHVPVITLLPDEPLDELLTPPSV